MVLTKAQVATICAALQFWAEEICPHGPQAARPYLQGLTPQRQLNAQAVEDLRSKLANCLLRYGVLEPNLQQLGLGTLFKTNHQAADRARAGQIVATVLASG